MSTNKVETTKQEAVIQAMEKLNVVLGQIGTVQGNVHDLLIYSTWLVFKWKEEVGVIEKILNNITGHKGSFRVESLAYWYKHIAGISTKYDEKQGRYTCKLARDSYISEQGVVFTYDKTHLSQCKLEKHRFWKIAPVQIKELKLPTEVAKATSSAEIQLARMVAAAKMDPETLAKHISSMADRVMRLSQDPKIKEWVGEYFDQHPNEKPKEIDPSVQALVEDSESLDQELAAPISDSEFENELKELMADVPTNEVEDLKQAA